MTNSEPSTAGNVFAIASRVTRESASNLWFVGQALGEEKRRLFEASYATMRVIDDYVDDAFLVLPVAERESRREEASGHVKKWIEAARCSIDGREAEMLGCEKEQALFEALRRTVGASDLAIEPWERLGAAMQFDVEEKTLHSWSDFEAYCEGATVAPAAVFLYVLQASVAEGGVLRGNLSSDTLTEQARDMAVFCYLVHILRDFGKDAARGGQLLTIPEEAFQAHALDRKSVEEAPWKATPLLKELVERAGERRLAARVMADEMIPELKGVEGKILDSLLSIYENLHDDLIRDPTPNLDRSGIVDKLRGVLSRTLGLEPV